MSDLLGLGVLGAGWITRAHGLAIRTLPHLASRGRPVRMTMLAARGRERGEAMARGLEIDRFTTDWREVVDDPSVHVVANLMGVLGHREASEAGLALGKPVLCEKPLGVDRFEARAMAAAAAAADVPAVCGVNYRCVPAMRLARDIVRSDALGGRVSPPPPQRVPGGHGLRPHRGFPALPRLRGRGRPGDRGEADRIGARRRGRIYRGGRPARRRYCLARSITCGTWLERPVGGRGPRHPGIAVVEHGGPEPAPRVLRGPRGGRYRRLPGRSGDPARASVPRVVVTSRAYAGLGAQLCAREARLPVGGRRRSAGPTASGHVRGRLPGRCRLRCDLGFGT